MELLAVRRKQSVVIANISLTTHVNLLQWLHHKKTTSNLNLPLQATAYLFHNYSIWITTSKSVLYRYNCYWNEIKIGQSIIDTKYLKWVAGRVAPHIEMSLIQSPCQLPNTQPTTVVTTKIGMFRSDKHVFFLICSE